MKYRLFLVMLTIAASCSRNASTIVAFQEVKTIEHIQNVLELTDFHVVPVNTAGLIDLAVCDTLLLVSSSSDKDKYVTAYGIKEYNKVGSVFNKGRANGELSGPKSFSSMGVDRSGDHFYVYVFDGQQNLIKVDLDNSLRSGNTVFETIESDTRLIAPRITFLDDSSLMITSLDESNCRKIRCIRDDDGTTRTTNNQNFLNDYSVSDPKDINAISTLSSYGSKYKRVVEAGLQLNSIHIYSLSDNFAKTIHLGKPLSVESLLSMRESHIKDQFGHLVAYDDFFALLYYNASESDQINGRVTPRLLLFQWDGTPLAELPISFPASSFDIDLRTGEIYLLDRQSDAILKCKLPSDLSWLISGAR